MTIAAAQAGLARLIDAKCPTVTSVVNGDVDNLPIDHTVKAVVALDEDFVEFQPEDGDMNAITVKFSLIFATMAGENPAAAEQRIAQATFEAGAAWWTPDGVSLMGADGVRRARFEDAGKGYVETGKKQRVLVAETLVSVVISV